MENELLKGLYDCFYAPPERKLVLRIIDAQDSITEQTVLQRTPPSTALSPDLNWRGGSR